MKLSHYEKLSKKLSMQQKYASGGAPSRVIRKNKIFGTQNQALLRRRGNLQLSEIHTSQYKVLSSLRSEGNPVNSTEGIHHSKNQMSWHPY